MSGRYAAAWSRSDTTGKAPKVNACCSECGRPLPKSKPLPGEPGPDATDAERFAHFKRTAPIEDLRFMIRIGTSELPISLADAWIAAANAAPSRSAADNKRIYKSLCQRWRAWSNDVEGRPATHGYMLGATPIAQYDQLNQIHSWYPYNRRPEVRASLEIAS